MGISVWLGAATRPGDYVVVLIGVVFSGGVGASVYNIVKAVNARKQAPADLNLTTLSGVEKGVAVLTTALGERVTQLQEVRAELAETRRMLMDKIVVLDRMDHHLARMESEVIALKGQYNADNLLRMVRDAQALLDGDREDFPPPHLGEHT